VVLSLFLWYVRLLYHLGCPKTYMNKVSENLEDVLGPEEKIEEN
jgi:hypothetical protein